MSMDAIAHAKTATSIETVTSALTGTDLEHYGRLGMKWYQHIFTSAEEYRKARQRKKNLEKARAAKAAKKKAEEDRAKRKEAAKKSMSSVYKNKELFTKEELKEIMADFRFDKEMRDLARQDRQKVLDGINEVTKWVTGGTAAWNAVAKIYNSLNGDEEDLPIIGDGKKKDKDKKKD